MERKLLLPVDVRAPNNTGKLKWLATQTPAVIELSKDLYRQIRPFCTDKTCRKMTAGKYEYQWKHHPRSKKPRSYPAQYYLKLMFQWVNQQKHIFDMESMRHDRLVKHMGEEDFDEPTLHPVFKNQSIRILIVDYLHDPFYYLTGIWAKAFSVYAHVFCQHFTNEELTPEVKAYVEGSFERFMRFVKAYRILSTRRLAPLDKRIAQIDFKSLPQLVQQAPSRESKSVLINNERKATKALSRERPSVMTSSLVKLDDSKSGSTALIKSDSYVVLDNLDKSPLLDKKENQPENKKTVKEEEKEGYVSDPEVASGGEGEEPGGDHDDFDDRNRAASGGLEISARLNRADSGVETPDKERDEQPGLVSSSKEKVS